MSGPYSEAAWEYRQAGWMGVLPLPPRQKAPVLPGWTGHAGGWPSGADIEAWVEGPEGAGNIALRLPPDVLGLDIDAYGDKQGAGTITEAAARWGSLPKTWRSTNRARGQGSILLFTVPEGLAWPGELGAGVEIIQHTHRYLVAPPSIHPEGRVYRWVSPDGAESSVPPEPGDLPELPVSWVDGITGMRSVGEAAHAGFTGEEVTEWLAKHGAGEMCVTMRRAVANYQNRVTLGGSRHEAARDAILYVVGLGAEGHLGMQDALMKLQSEFRAAVDGDPNRPRDSGEWRRMVDGAVQLNGMRTLPEHDPCFIPTIAPYQEMPSRPAVVIHNGSYLNNTVFPPLQYTIAELLPEGFTLMVGPPKIGKSYLVLDWALARATGGLALGTIPMLPGPVFYLALEDGDRRIQQRCRQLLGSEPIPDLFEYTVSVRPAELLSTLSSWISEHRDSKPLVVLDTLGIVMPLQAQGEGPYQRDYRIARELKDLIDTASGGALVVNHHDRKQAAMDFIDAVSGTHGLAGAADTTIVVARDRLSREALLKVTGRDVREGQYAVTFTEGHWAVDGENLSAAEQAATVRQAAFGLGERAKDIIEFVRTHPGASPFEIAAGVGIPPGDCRVYLSRLVDKGRLVRPNRGRYTLPEGVTWVSLSLSQQNRSDNETQVTGSEVEGLGPNPEVTDATDSDKATQATQATLACSVCGSTESIIIRGDGTPFCSNHNPLIWNPGDDQ